jgi:hypothetical protein
MPGCRGSSEAAVAYVPIRVSGRRGRGVDGDLVAVSSFVCTNTSRPPWLRPSA